MLFNKKDKVAACFSKHYKNMLNITKAAKWIDNAQFELLPAMYVICDYAAISAGKDRRSIADSIVSEIKKLYPKYNAPIFKQRVELYGEIIRGKKLRGEFAFGNIDAWNSNAVMKITALWGDIIINPGCADNYDSAPLLLRGMDVVVEFFAGIMKPILNEMCKLFDEIYDI